MRGVPWRAHFRACPRDPLAILPIVAVLLLIIVPVMVATVGIAQEVRQGQGVLERLVFLPAQNQFEIILQEAAGKRTLTADNRVVLIKLDSRVSKDPETAALARHGPVVLYQWEHQPRIKKPYLRRVVVIFADVSQLKAFLTTP